VSTNPNASGGEKGRTPFQKVQALAKALLAIPKAEADQKAKEERKRKNKK
jgi:hypothetical protein